VRALQRLDRHVEMAGCVGDRPEQRQVTRFWKAVRVGLHQQLVGLLPTSPRRCLACALDAHGTPP
jgi:sugar/nucleoside kinase (ribokinase family)